MRDHPSHDVRILAGMFGIRIENHNRNYLRKMSRIILMAGKYHNERGYDQVVIGVS